MIAPIFPVRERKPKQWVIYFVLGVLVLYLFLELAPTQTVRALLLISPFRVSMPRISGTVVDAMTGKPLPGMDVCLLALVSSPSIGTSGRELKIMRNVSMRTDASGSFSFARWSDMLDWFDRSAGYGIAVTDPAARWNEKCGSSFYLLSAGPDVLEHELELEGQLPASAEKKRLPYFPAAVVYEPLAPSPAAYDESALSWLPRAGLLRKISDGKNADRKLRELNADDMVTGYWEVGGVQNLTIPLIPLFADEGPCRAATNPNLVEVCRQMNLSYIAGKLRTASTNSSSLLPTSASDHR